ncbi:hypothetical protein [Actinomadura sp. DC4]|uniref:hypothetical protein n=1 Tax=Actinomadura sp. DC4 TaxID=3055069 RepID=UPI0025AFF00C|nr:hypothetical protein [Actinomadura sp. DC4]MDN3354386.1 hypothetical protein [Actinomadura sp. DC4]
MPSRLAPPYGSSADFLTPYAGVGSLQAGAETVPSTTRGRLRDDLCLADRQRRLPGRAGPAA